MISRYPDSVFNSTAMSNWLSDFKAQEKKQFPDLTVNTTSQLAIPGISVNLNAEELWTVQNSSEYWVVKLFLFLLLLLLLPFLTASYLIILSLFLATSFRTTCPACSKFASLYRKLAQRYQSNPLVHFGEVNCPKSKGLHCLWCHIRSISHTSLLFHLGLCKSENVNSVPTIEMFDLLN